MIDVNAAPVLYANGRETDRMTNLPADPEAFRRALAKEMEMQGRSQAALAKRLGVHQSAISRMLSGDRRVRVDEAAIIADYLAETAPDAVELITLVDGSDDVDEIGKYPDIMSLLEETIASDAGMGSMEVLTVENDYEFVIRMCASLSVALQRCVIATSKTTQDAELRELSRAVWRYDTSRKVAALVRVERLWQHEGEGISSIFAVRDALVHSPAKLSLLDPRLFARLEGILRVPPGTEPTPQLVRALFALGASVMLMRLGEADPKKTAGALRDAANDLESMR